MKDVLIIMGSDSDLPVMKEAAMVLDALNITYHLTIVSAHRTPKRMFDVAENAREKGYKCIIAGAGGAAHLPVIGVPIKTSTLSGTDSLHSIVQMPPGIPVGTMAIDGARNAGIYAAKIIAVGRPELWNDIRKFMKSLEEQVLSKALDLENKGYQKYLEKK
jgi:5-(carboxyamino)imidazole ribonucleotide mutase